MTHERRRYNNNRDWFSSLPPPMPPLGFQHVMVRVFPLRAKISVLRRFCASTFNIAPRSVGRFYPSLPYVYLLFLDYGKMAGEGNLGWVSQHEVTLSVPLDWYRWQGGRRQLAGQVWATPFIFVDDPSSLTGGREVYGWPKVLVSLDPCLDPWISDPSNPHHLITLSVGAESTIPGDDRRRQRPLLEIEHLLAQSAALAPPDLRLLDPLANVSRLLRTSLSLSQDLLRSLTGVPLAGYPRREPGPFPATLRNGLRGAAGLLSDPGSAILTLKQFRDATYPEHICYQALVHSRIGIDAYNRGGTLGNVNLLLGDPSGGFRIRIHRHLAHPVVESLGLEVADRIEVEGRAVDILEPILPCWMDVDLSYDVGKVLCWRTRKSPWFVGRTPVPGTGPDPVAHPYGHVYSTFTTGTVQARPGPFHYSDTKYFVFPLLADRACLQRFVGKLFPAERSHFFRPWGEHVYMVASGGQAASEASALAWFGAAEVDFFVPVLRYERTPAGSARLAGVGLAEAFAFIDDVALTLTAREVVGEPAFEATVESPPESWLAGTDRLLLRVRTDVFSAVGEGLKSERRLLLEVVMGDVFQSADDVRWQGIAEGWCSALVADFHAKLEAKPKPQFDVLKELAKQIAAGRAAVNIFTLKQFRDATEPHFACYQALVETQCQLRNIRAWGEFNLNAHILLHRYPTHPISDVLGLKVKYRAGRPETAGTLWEGAMVEYLQPVRPFWFRAGQRTSSRELSRRAGDLDWGWSTASPLPGWDETVESVPPQPVIESLLHDHLQLTFPGKPEFFIRADSAGLPGKELLKGHGLELGQYSTPRPHIFKLPGEGDAP